MNTPDPTTPLPAAGTNEGAAPPIGAAPDGCKTRDDCSSFKSQKQAFHAAEAEYLTCRAVALQVAWDAGLRNGVVDIYGNRHRRHDDPSKYNVPGLPGVVYAKHLPIPYQECLDKIPRVRLRMLEHEVVLRAAEEDGGSVVMEAKVAKYGRWLAQREVSVVPYLPPQVLEVAHDVSVPLHFVEGPVKALSLISHGFVSVGLGGAEAGFRDPGQHDPAHRDRLHPELGRILWQGRTVFLLPDSGHRENPAVCRGTARLALFLRRQGAIVKIARLPLMRSVTINAEIASLKLDATDVWLAITEARLAPKDNGDLGPDDYLALHQLLGRHLRQEPLVYARDRLTRVLDEAALGDPVEWAAASGPSVLDDLLYRALVQEAGEGAIAQVAKALGVGIRAVRAAVKGYAEAASKALSESEHAYVEKDGCTWIRTGWSNGEGCGSHGTA